ncbi:MAG TPA: alpha/beta hydrolase [Rhizomicrobium sp.]|nr:alpha/beta hydrolase [Rhizomicrobium sp.]
MGPSQSGELVRDDGNRVAYRKREGRGPTLVWFGGFKSEMTSTKPEALDAWAAREGRALLRFDYFGHGVSSGNFRDGTVTRWREDALSVIDTLSDGPLILVGSSMGAWLAVLSTLARPQRVAGLLLIAPATDFTSYPTGVRETIMRDGVWLWPSAYDDQPYPITRNLIEDGRKHLLLQAPIPVTCPVRIVQGMADPDVPWEHAMRLVGRLGEDVEVTLVKAGDHRLSKPHEIALILRELAALADKVS